MFLGYEAAEVGPERTGLVGFLPGFVVFLELRSAMVIAVHDFEPVVHALDFGEVGIGHIIGDDRGFGAGMAGWVGCAGIIEDLVHAVAQDGPVLFGRRFRICRALNAAQRVFDFVLQARKRLQPLILFLGGGWILLRIEPFVDVGQKQSKFFATFLSFVWFELDVLLDQLFDGLQRLVPAGAASKIFKGFESLRRKKFGGHGSGPRANQVS